MSVQVMKKADLKFIVDGLLFISAVGAVLIGLLLGFVIPQGPVGSDEAKYFLGLHRHAWGDIHLYLGIAFAALAALHLVLGWSWVKGKASQLFQRRWAAAVASMPVLALLVVFALWAASPGDGQKYADHAKAIGRTTRMLTTYARPSPGASATHTRERGRPLSRGRDPASEAGAAIAGRMSLRSIERRTGASARHLARELGLPRASLEQRLRRSRRTHAVASLTRGEVELLAPGRLAGLTHRQKRRERRLPGSRGRRQ